MPPQRAMHQQRTYCHITHYQNKKSILKNGLLADQDGHIFLMSSRVIRHIDTNTYVSLSDIIASNQVSLSSYWLLSVRATGISAPLIPDNVAEFTAPFQWIANQPRIAPEYLRDLGVHSVNPKRIQRFYNALYNLNNL